MNPAISNIVVIALSTLSLHVSGAIGRVAGRWRAQTLVVRWQSTSLRNLGNADGALSEWVSQPVSEIVMITLSSVLFRKDRNTPVRYVRQA